jgi:hypothetical protein
MAISHLLSRATGVTASVLLATAAFQAAPARANIVFDFSGVCDSGCSGKATGVLTLERLRPCGLDVIAIFESTASMAPIVVGAAD